MAAGILKNGIFSTLTGSLNFWPNTTIFDTGSGRYFSFFKFKNKNVCSFKT